VTSYTGALMRAASGAHFSMPNSVPGTDPRHEHPVNEPDPFDPNVQPPASAEPQGDVWQPQDQTPHTQMTVQPVSHWGQNANPVPLNVHSFAANNATQSRMLGVHSHVDYRPDQYVPYTHATEGRSIEFMEGRESAYAGQSVPDEMSYLVAGKNAYDFTNQPNEVYSGDAANVGRYRLGYTVNEFGSYDFWTKQGQDGMLRAYTGLEPAVPVDKPRIEDSAPYTPNSSGTTTWTLPAFQVPSFFASPSETASTDYEMVNGDVMASSGSFSDDGRM